MNPTLPSPADVLDLLPDAVCVVDADGRYLSVSAGFERILGYRAQEVIGRQAFEFVHPEDRDATVQQAEQVMEGWIQRHFRNRYLHRDGHVVDMQWSARWHPAHRVRIGVGREVTELRRVERELEHLASHDPLTGLPNRHRLDQVLQRTLARAQAIGETFAVLYIDLDGFKAVNDIAGHEAGDRLLQAVANRLQQGLRHGDTAARMGGDEFAIVQRGGTQPEAAEALAARLVDLIGRTYVLEGHMINVGASVGVAVAPSDGSTAAILLKNADLALYRAKFDGRGTFRFFEREMDVRMQARRAMEIDLRRALAMRQFHLLYQPQVELAGNRIVGFEALLRWTHETRGLVPPAEFIPLAEEIGVIGTIGEWVLRTACVEAATWPEGVSVAVNLSPVQFHSGKLVETVASALAHSGLAPDRLELEITEGALLNDTEAVLVALNRLRAIGARISMDDFGTGYSSLSYLQKFPFDKIKIDQSFIRGMGDNLECGAIVRAVAGLGASLGMKTTAEGVETAEQLAAIRAEGCCEVQGYLTGRPISATDAASLLAAQPTHSAS